MWQVPLSDHARRAICDHPAVQLHLTALRRAQTGQHLDQLGLTIALDSGNAEAVMNLMGELHDEGATICMVTHDPRWSSYCERTVNLFDGRVVEDDALVMEAASVARVTEAQQAAEAAPTQN